MRKIISMLIVIIMLVGMLPVVGFAATATVSATKAFCWNFSTNAQHGSLPMMRGSLQNTNYNYTEGAMDWVEEKLAEIGEDETVIFMAHFPLGDSITL